MAVERAEKVIKSYLRLYLKSDIPRRHIRPISMPKRFSYWTIATIIVVITAWFSEGYHHPDEHFQILEFANLKLGRTSPYNMPWEWAREMRPGLQPMLTVGYLRAVEAAGLTNPFQQVFLLRLLTGLLSLALLWRWYRVLHPELGDYFGKMAAFLWCMPYLGVRYSSECWSALCFGAGLLLVYGPVNARRLLLSGFLMGLSFQFRYQIAFAIAGLFVWLFWVKKTEWKNLLLWVAGTVPAFVIGLLADGALYGKWLFPAWNYLKINIFEGAAATFGVEPFWWYFPEFLMKIFHPVGIALLVLAYFGFQKTKMNPWIWAMIPFVLVHCLIGHKEMRFLFPAVTALLVMAAAGWERLDREWGHKRAWRVGWKTAVGINIALLPLIMFRPALEAMPYFHYVYDHQQQHPDAVLFVEKRNPYHVVGTLPAIFYQPKALKMAMIPDYTTQLPENKTPDDLFLSEKINHPAFSDVNQFETAYCYFPAAIQYVDFGGWQARSRIWKIYRFKTPQ